MIAKRGVDFERGYRIAACGKFSSERATAGADLDYVIVAGD